VTCIHALLIHNAVRDTQTRFANNTQRSEHTLDFQATTFDMRELSYALHNDEASTSSDDWGDLIDQVNKLVL